ncbi:MAG TPA: tetratricopeptide repeat protein [Longimicrobiales bacterium]|nr:tetratricopeptide repeat protein [Longimicrobiales bacterium]
MEPLVEQVKQQGLQAFERRDYRLALELFRGVLEKHPRYADIRQYAGLCLSFLGEPEAALEQFDRALEVNPGYVEALVNRALTLNELGRYEEARESFEQAGRHEQESAGLFSTAVTARIANAHAAVGDLYVAAGAHDLAVEQYQRALELRARFHDIRNKLALSQLELGRPAEAAQELLRVLAGNPRFLSARINLGLAYFRLGLPHEAAQEWQIASHQDPANPQVRAFLAMLESNIRQRSPRG